MSFCCICTEAIKEWTSLTDKDECGVDYLSKLRTCVPQETWEPYFLLCNPCAIQLNRDYGFVQVCLKNKQFREKNLKQTDKIEVEQTKTSEQYTFSCHHCQKGFKQKSRLASHIRINHNKVRKKKLKKEKIEVEKNLNEIKTEDKKVGKEIKLENTNAEYSNSGSDVDGEANSYSDIELKAPATVKKEKNKPKDCGLCGEGFKAKHLWMTHMKKMHRDFKPFCCDQCDAQYLNDYSLLIHRRKHTNERPFICSICGKSFISSADLNHHIKIHDNNRSYLCEICDKSYKTHSNLRTHKLQVHLDQADWEFVCKICGKKFPLRSNLVKHMKRHEGIKNFTCHVCQKRFVNRPELRIHLNTHTDQRPFKCQLCSNTYKNREGLRRHMKVVHELGNWKYVIPQKRFQCSMCPKMFNFSNKLQRHIYSHTGERPFACDFCPKRFIDTYGKKVHVKKDHPNEEIL